MTGTGQLERLRMRRLDLLPDFAWGKDEQDIYASIVSGSCEDAPLGQFAGVQERPDSFVLIRDRLGLNKLFYHVNAEQGLLTVGHYLYDVAEASGDYNGVRSVPAGHYLVVDRNTCAQRMESYWDLSRIEPEESFDLPRFHAEVDRRLSDFFTLLHDTMPDAHFLVCLSGGLDSSIIAYYARKHLPRVSALSFSYETLSEDFHAAESIAGTLGLPFLPVIEPTRLDEDVLRDVMRSAQDYRDFNVHCAWVNYHIAKAMRPAQADERYVFLTGDLMNEYVADYQSETYEGETYYRLPKVSRERLRRFLVYGLDSSDRELGVFHAHGFPAVQPYSNLAELYLTVPASLLQDSDGKSRLNRPLLMRAGIESYVGRSKVRAQVGGKDGGTLGLFHRNRITQDGLIRRWNDLFRPLTREERPQPIVIAGRYRS